MPVDRCLGPRGKDIDAADPAAAGHETVAMTVCTDGARGLLVEGGSQYHINEATVRRSEVLRSLSSTLSGQESVDIPISELDFRRWHEFATGTTDEIMKCGKIVSLCPSVIVQALKVSCTRRTGGMQACMPPRVCPDVGHG